MSPFTSGSLNSDQLNQLADWVVAQAVAGQELPQLFPECCERLCAAGLPLWRAHITFGILHPLYESMSITWTRGRPLDVQSYLHRTEGPFPDAFLASPLYYMMETDTLKLRRRLAGPNAVIDFPVLEDIKKQGGCDYSAFLTHFSQGKLDGVVGSWTSDRSEGFSDAHIAVLDRMQNCLMAAAKMWVREAIAESVVNTYLGPNAGLRVLDGQIRRGDGETIRAALWYSDLRDSTRLAGDMNRTDYITLLNLYFEATAGAVLAAKGEVLSFIGDAVLAIFPMEFPMDLAGGSAAAACRRALSAYRESERRLAALNENRRAEGQDTIASGLALHLGDVIFGNIGVPERLSFSVIGPTVNEVARLEALTKELDCAVVASRAFAEHIGEAWVDRGRFHLKGVAEPISVYVPENPVGPAPEPAS